MCGENFNFINEWKSHMIYCLSIENQISYQNEDWDYNSEVKTKTKVGYYFRVMTIIYKSANI